MPDLGVTPPRAASIESRASWTAACLTLAILSISYGSPLLVVVGLKPIQEALGTDRSVVALAGALVWVGTGVGGIMMGWLADRIGIRADRDHRRGDDGAGPGDFVASARVWALYVGHGLLIGLLGNGAIYAPLVVYVSRWFDRRRGSALALISSGQYIAGMVWPSVFERGIAAYRLADRPCWPMPPWWSGDPAADPAVLRPAPEPLAPHRCRAIRARARRCWGCMRNLVLALICIAGVLLLHSDGDAERRISWRSAPTSASCRRMARRCCRCCWPARSSPGSSGECWPTASAGCAR